MGKNSHLHLLIETPFHNSLKREAESRKISLAELCRQKLKKPEIDLKELAFDRLKSCRTKNGIISFKKIWTKLCTNFSIPKEDCWKLLRDFEKEKRIKFVRGHGIRIKY